VALVRTFLEYIPFPLPLHIHPLASCLSNDAASMGGTAGVQSGNRLTQTTNKKPFLAWLLATGEI
jgi:hypothetical protein